ncbi:hypothetical protein Clacol_005503 [Clathrus columnatus]|uniref:BRCT domain-containing protein n=1 Tax=Clathrus columnatus TaxID=1419009 RepID=A0AAV5AFL0_9AGAM|nr:hypothetical protein Clacol_005503 [Clathrus columnatus]
MPPTARHHVQRSSIRTRSHQQQPTIPVDLTASPLKAIRRQNQIATQHQHTSTSAISELHVEQMLPVSNSKRSPSPSSFSRMDETKRPRVSVEREETEVAKSYSPLETLSIDTASVIEPRETPEAPLTRDVAHVDLIRLSRSPLKAPPSPLKVFKITMHSGGTLEVPVTPARKSIVNSEELMETEIVSPLVESPLHSQPTQIKRQPILFKSNKTDTTSDDEPSSHAKQGSEEDIVSNPTEDFVRASTSLSLNPVSDLDSTSEFKDPTHQTVTFLEPPMTPVPITTNAREHLVQFKTPLKSRLPQPASSLKTFAHDAKTPGRTPGLLAATISSLAKAKAPVSPMRLRSRSQLKVKLGIKDKTPTSKLALKRTVRRNSLNKEKIKGTTAALPANPPKLFPTAGKNTKGKTQTTLNGFFKQRSVISRDPSSANSPSKPTPLVALSTALKKLEVTAPLPPSRPSMNNGPSQNVHQEANTARSQNNVADVSERNTAATESANATPKARLPMRLPSNPDINGRAPWVQCDSPSNKNPPSINSSDPNNIELKPTIFDVDACEALEQKENKPPIEFFVPVVDESNATKKLQALAPISPSRRASQASLALSQSLSAPNKPQIFPNPRSVSTSHLQLNPRSPVKTRGKTKPSLPPTEAVNQTNGNGKRLNARMPGSLDVLTDCVIYADIRTEEGEDAAPLFVDMLRGLGARILSKPGKSCTHLVFKAGVPSTVVKYKLLPEPKPLVVSIGWVVECVEKRSHVEETRFLVNLDDIDITGGSQRRRSMTMQPKQIRALISGHPTDQADNSINGDTSFTSEDSSAIDSYNDIKIV